MILYKGLESNRFRSRMNVGGSSVCGMGSVLRKRTIYVEKIIWYVFGKIKDKLKENRIRKWGIYLKS